MSLKFFKISEILEKSCKTSNFGRNWWFCAKSWNCGKTVKFGVFGGPKTSKIVRFVTVRKSRISAKFVNFEASKVAKLLTKVMGNSAQIYSVLGCVFLRGGGCQIWPNFGPPLSGPRKSRFWAKIGISGKNGVLGNFGQISQNFGKFWKFWKILFFLEKNLKKIFSIKFTEILKFRKNFRKSRT